MPVPEQSKLKQKVRALPDGPGVYLMRDRLGSVLYVGKAKNLKKRVSSYFQPSRRFSVEQPKIAAMLDLIEDFDIVEVANESEALLLEGKLIKEWRPRYNTDFVDDKRFLHIRVDQTVELPRFRLVRFRSPDNAIYFGPFAHSGLVRRTLQEMRLKYGILLGDAHPQRSEDGQWKLYADARAEIYGHANLVTTEEYRQRVNRGCAFLEGKSREWVAELEQQMQAAARNLDFERAADLRDALEALRKTTQRNRKFTQRGLLVREDPRPLELLKEALQMECLPRRMECFDISHISGTFCVASMVHFLDGKPDRKQYRRYQIRSFVGNDDFRAMCEVVARRYQRLHSENRSFPDLVVIDGGAGQVASALFAFEQIGLQPPMLIGLAKREETVHFADGRAPLQLPGYHAGRLLLQNLRDEAHRHANRYNAELRSRRIRETVLDSFPGLGPAKRRSILGHFGSLEALKVASVEQLLEVEGVGPKLAQRLHDFLQELG